VTFLKTGILTREDIRRRCKTVTGTDADAVLQVCTVLYTGRRRAGTPTVRAGGYTGRLLCGVPTPTHGIPALLLQDQQEDSSPPGRLLDERRRGEDSSPVNVREKRRLIAC